jgi:alkanesulfonate monooxygenase SsuD/methylene tetrahydromethanopterin reductase-like flavin-dependent oxidoreductase (luciferase family)
MVRDLQRLRFGAHLPVFASQFEAFRSKALAASLIEDLGFDSFWFGDHVTEIWYPPPPTQDPFCVLSALATKTRKILLGTAVTDVHKRPPVVLSQAAATLDQISDGRLLLGLGGGEAMNLDPFHIPWDCPIDRAEEVVEIVKQLWKGLPVNHDGRFFKLRNAFLQVEPVQKPHPPVYFAAASHRSRELVGRLCDGWIAMLTTPDLFAKDKTHIQEVASQAGRKPSEIDMTYYVDFAISPNFDEAREKAIEAAKAAFLCFPKQARRFGYRIMDRFDWEKVTAEFGGGVADELRKQIDEVPTDIAEKVPIFGTPETCIERIEDYVRAGVTHFILCPVEADLKGASEYYRSFAKSVLPYFKEEAC